MSRIVRQSKYRHVFGTVAKREDCYDELRVTRSAWDSNFVAANAQYWAVIAEAGGGGAFMVAPHKQTGKWDAKAPMITGHKNAVLDLDFHPFNESLVASASEDCTVKIWGIPEGGLKENMTEALQTLTGHRRKVGTIKFHPSANNILASTGADFSVKIWEVEKGKDVLSIDAQHGDIIQSADWSLDGSLLCTSCKDKKLRVLDPRTQKVAQVRPTGLCPVMTPLFRRWMAMQVSRAHVCVSLEPTRSFLLDSPRPASVNTLCGILVT